jgi:hypothetical protein
MSNIKRNLVLKYIYTCRSWYDIPEIGVLFLSGFPLWKTINNYLKNTTHIINDRSTRTTLKIEGQLLEKLSRTCSPVTPVELFLLQTWWYTMNEERTGMWSFFTHIFLSGLSSNDGHCKTVEVMPSTLPQGNIGSVQELPFDF